MDDWRPGFEKLMTWVFVLFLLATHVFHRAPRTLNEAPPDLLNAAFRAVLPINLPVNLGTTYCLGYDRYHELAERWEQLDPPGQVVQLVARSGLQVRSASQCVHVGDAFVSGVVDTTTRERATIVLLEENLYSPVWEGDTLLIRASYSCGLECGGGGVIRLLRRGGLWHGDYDEDL